jgi:hypothetical protein
MSDAAFYAERLAAKLDYRNTFYDRAPRFDLLNPQAGDLGQYDFLLASEVFEHIQPPVAVAFANALQLLKPTGVLVFTVPYSLDPATIEHFPNLHRYGLSQVAGQTVLVNRSANGAIDATDQVVFHIGCAGPAPELREFSECGLRAALLAAGFPDVRIYNEDYPPFGIVRSETWSLPIVARRGEFALNAEVARDIGEHWQEAHRQLKRVAESWWFQLGYRLRLFR